MLTSDSSLPESPVLESSAYESSNVESSPPLRCTATDEVDLEKVAYLKIFPPIGIGRMGNSPVDFFLGPEVPGLENVPAGPFKDAEGRIKRQAARFRVYGFDEQGKVVGEINALHSGVDSLSWHVHLANRKADWYEFDGAEKVARILAGDIDDKTDDINLRNFNLKTEIERKGLVLQAECEITGENKKSLPLNATFQAYGGPPVEVHLGELRTDEAGRLVVLGGLGESGSVLPDPVLRSYANNDGWYDDSSDGRIRARVVLKSGHELEFRGNSWVVIAPPHFSPHTHNIVTLYDAIEEAAEKHGLAWPEAELGPKPNRTAPPLFSRDIYPLLERLTMLQWVSRRVQRGHSPGKRGDFFNPEVVKILADAIEAAKPNSLHKHIFKRVRNPILHLPYTSASKVELSAASYEARQQANLGFMPPLAGDEGDVVMGDPTTWLSVTTPQYLCLQRWSEGDFLNDWEPDVKSDTVAQPLENLRVEEQPAALTRAALEACQGGAFFPGIEMTSIIRFSESYDEAFRLSSSLEPGDVTKWMALPWQADFYECQSHWWPAIRPDDVVPEEAWKQILEEFKKEEKTEEAESRIQDMLLPRQPWDRGLALNIPARPGLPMPSYLDFLPIEERTPQRYKEFCSIALKGLINEFVRVVPKALPGETGVSFRRRIQDYIDSTVLESPDFDVEAPENADVLTNAEAALYRENIKKQIENWLETTILIPDPAPKATLSDYYKRVLEFTKGTIFNGLTNVDWRSRAGNVGKLDMVANWSKLGFVAPCLTPNNETVLVETERDKYEMLSFRDYFFLLMNIEKFPEFLPKARQLADEYLKLGWQAMLDISNLPEYKQYRFFRYSEVAFEARMEQIYEIERRAGEDYNPAFVESEALFRTPAHVVERIRQLAPYNQLDGSWLENIAKAGPISEIHSFLFEIWADEMGNGDPTQNHANVYTDLLHSANIYLPPLNSRAYADNPDIWEGSFQSPVYQSSIALFPESYFPELLGMTLYLEWEAVFLPAMVKLYEYHGYNPLFYKLHVAIDNAVNGHGARAKQAVVAYLSHVLTESGDAEMQQHWKRIWNGYLSFKLVGGGNDIEYNFTNPSTLEDQMLEMMRRKRHYAQLNHGKRSFGDNSLNDWFDEPDQFLSALANSDLVTRGDARNSKIFEVMGFQGPMLKVFTPKEISLWEDWINSLPRDPGRGRAMNTGQAMEALLEEFRARGMAVPEHAAYTLIGKVPDPKNKGALIKVEKPINWWFTVGFPKHFMKALSDPKNKFIVPKKPHESRLVTEFLTDNGRMSKLLRDVVPELGGKPARTIIIEWIEDGCPTPEIAVPTHVTNSMPLAVTLRDTLQTGPRTVRTRANEDFAERIVERSVNANRQTNEQSRSLRRRIYGPGMGAAH